MGLHCNKLCFSCFAEFSCRIKSPDNILDECDDYEELSPSESIDDDIVGDSYWEEFSYMKYRERTLLDR